VLARSDGTLGPGLTRVAVDCDAEYRLRLAEEETAIAAGLLWPPLQDPDPSVQRQCGLRLEPQGPSSYGLLMTGDTTSAALVLQLRSGMRRLVVDKTGLSGSYRVRLIYDAVPFPDSVPYFSAAVREQLGLRFRSSRAEQDTLVVDRIERPTVN
jgi:Protein of unknown function (DUF3738)